jgi:hypothetical protein
MGGQDRRIGGRGIASGLEVEEVLLGRVIMVGVVGVGVRAGGIESYVNLCEYCLIARRIRARDVA